MATGGVVDGRRLRCLHQSARQQALAKLDRLWGGLEPDVYRFRAAGHWHPDQPDDPAVAARHLARYGLAGPNVPVVVADWTDHDDIRTLPTADRNDLELWLIEQTWRLASRLHDASDDPDDLRRALTALERVPVWSSLGPFLDLRRQIRDRLGLPSPPPRTSIRHLSDWRESYALGLQAETLHAREALRHYRRILSD